MEVFIWRILLGFFLIFSRVAGYSGEVTGNFDDYQTDLISYNAAHILFPDGQGKLLTLGLLENSIVQLKNRFPRLQIISIDDQLSSLSGVEFYSMESDERWIWENQYDAIIIFLALEKDPHRESRVRLMYDSLKPKKKGMLFITPKGAFSLDHWVEKFLEDSKWRQLVSNTPNLSIVDCRAFIENAGFSIVEEKRWGGILNNQDTSKWLCDRWAVPFPMRISFVWDFSCFLERTFDGRSNIFLDVFSLLVEK